MEVKNLSIFNILVDIKLSSGTRYADDRFLKLIDSLTEKDYIDYIKNLFVRYSVSAGNNFTKCCLRDAETYDNIIFGILVYMYQYNNNNKISHAKTIFHRVVPKKVKFVPSNIIPYNENDDDPLHEDFIVKNIPSIMIDLIDIIDDEVNAKSYYKTKRISLLATTEALVHLGKTRKADFIKNKRYIRKITDDLTKYLSTLNELSIDNSCSDDETNIIKSV